MENEELVKKTENTLWEQVKASANERLGSPFYFSLFLSFVLSNWDLFYILFFHKLTYNEFNTIYEIYSIHWVIPLVTAVGYSVIYIIPNVFTDFLAHVYKTIGENKKLEYSNKNKKLDFDTSNRIKKIYDTVLLEKEDKIRDNESRYNLLHDKERRKLISLFSQFSGYGIAMIQTGTDRIYDNIPRDKYGFVILKDPKDESIHLFNSPKVYFSLIDLVHCTGLMVGREGDSVFYLQKDLTKFHFKDLPIENYDLIEKRISQRENCNLFVSSSKLGFLRCGNRNDYGEKFWSTESGEFLKIGSLNQEGFLFLDIRLSNNCF
ncbi:hypothetical protein [Leptospira kmetyi]|uniref:hypothetical protein n=1 Tax=Leptospira kmetyi TaxID=408139 RepID=UPI000289B686|nr:hypothetical protein [Leptospira kmetyi]EQA55380.1 hypothetical protein LEP1GSC052_0041 [Leptospira kmetyi serovar Malaysia str. Bejo-Iso9]